MVAQDYYDGDGVGWGVCGRVRGRDTMGSGGDGPGGGGGGIGKKETP